MKEVKGISQRTYIHNPKDTGNSVVKARGKGVGVCAEVAKEFGNGDIRNNVNN